MGNFEPVQSRNAQLKAARKARVRLGRGTPNPYFQSGYQIMWMLVTFDLPVETKAQRKAATKFRNDLLDLGFEMSQFSNYMRTCKGKEQYQSYCRKIEAVLPERGDVVIFHFTDKQYETIVRFSDQGRQRAKKNPEQLALF